MKRTSADAPKTWRDLARVTGLCEPSVKTAIKLGQLPGYHVGKLYVVPAEAFLRYCRGEWIPQPKAIEPLPDKAEAETAALAPPQFIRHKRTKGAA